MNCVEQWKHEQGEHYQRIVNSVRIMNSVQQPKLEQGEHDQPNVKSLKNSKHEEN